MNPSEQQIKIAADMYDIRDKVRRLLGDKYQPRMEELGKILSDISEKQGKEILTVAVNHCQTRSLFGMELLLTIAAAVELVEPSK